MRMIIWPYLQGHASLFVAPLVVVPSGHGAHTAAVVSVAAEV